MLVVISLFKKTFIFAIVIPFFFFFFFFLFVLAMRVTCDECRDSTTQGHCSAVSLCLLLSQEFAQILQWHLSVSERFCEQFSFDFVDFFVLYNSGGQLCS
jgi:hypothetical protein